MLTSSCIDEFLNREPLNVISENDVWVSANAIQAYMAKMYDDVLVEDLSTIGFKPRLVTYHYTDESMRSYSWGAPYTPTFSDEFIPRWTESYANIRIINEFLDKIPLQILMKIIEQYIAEAHFCEHLIILFLQNVMEVSQLLKLPNNMMVIISRT